MYYRFVNARVKRGRKASTSYENVVKIGSVTSEFKREFVEFLQKLSKIFGKNWHIPPNISATSGPVFTKL